jgi:hypothetical protein
MDGMDAQHTLRLYKLRIVEGGEKKNCRKKAGEEGKIYATLCHVEGSRPTHPAAVRMYHM